MLENPDMVRMKHFQDLVWITDISLTICTGKKVSLNWNQCRGGLQGSLMEWLLPFFQKRRLKRRWIPLADQDENLERI